LVCALATATISAVLIVTVASAEGGSFSGSYSSTAAFISSVFVFFASCTSIAGLLLAYLNGHYGGKTSEFVGRLLGRPEVFLLAVPALALATALVDRIAKHPLPKTILSLPVVLFGLAAFSGYMTKTDQLGFRSIRYQGSPFVFPIVLMVVVWLLSLLRGIVKSEMFSLSVLLLATALVVLALINKGPGDSLWTVGRINASLIGFALLVVFGGVANWLRDSFDAKMPVAATAICLLLIAAGATLAINFSGLAAQLMGRYTDVTLISVGRTGEFLLAAGMIFSAVLAMWAALSRPNQGTLA
jgi:hypothetical protein